MKTFVLLFLAALGSALAEDVKMANGTVLRGVTINWGDEAGVSMTPAGDTAMPTKYPWNRIEPNERPRVQAIVAAIAKRELRERAVEQTSMLVALEVISVEERGIVARFAKAVPSLISSDPDHPAYTHEAWDDHPIFIFLADTSGLSEGKKGLQKLYPVGTYRDSVGTYRAFVTRADDAADLAAQRKSEKVPKD